MPIETEYTRTYRPIVSSPHPSSPPIPAGISSAKQWISQEPPVGLKKKPLHGENRVTFLTDGGDDQGNSNQEIKSLKFKAGLRRPFTGVPTEYQRQFQWHEPAPKETPLLNNQHTHHSSKYPTTVRTSNRDSSQGICNQCQHRGDQHQTSESTDSEDVIIPQEPQEDPTNTHQQVNNKKKLSPRKADKYDVHGQKQKNFIQDLMSKQSERKAQIAKNAHKKMIRHFVTEYQRQFGKSNSKKAKKNKAKFDGSPIAGVPRALTDSSDPRLLKHSPLPISTALTSSLPTSDWTTNYRANYTSPSDSEFVGGAAHSSPQLERRTRMSPLTAVEEQTEHPLPITTFSWHDQLVELREKAEKYKKRAEGVSIRRLLPLTRQDLIDNNPPSSTITDFTSCATSSPTPSDSVSCTFSDCPHHHRDSRSPPRQAPASAGPTVWASRSPPRQAPTSAGPTVWASISPPEHARTTAGPTVRASRPRGSMQVHNGSSTQVHDMEEDNSEIESIHHIPGPPFQPKTLESDTGRVQTPVIQKSSSDYRRHHLYRTTPVAGGLFISPKKVPELILPYPPVSPKFRRDMKSSALINPAPKKTKEKYVQVDEGSSSQTTDQDYMPPMVTSSVTQPPVIVPISSSPYHTRCAPVTTSKSTSVRKLDFKARSQPKSATSKTMPKPYSHRVEGVRPTSNSSCNICGSCLRPHSSTANAGTTSSRLRSGLSSNLAGGGLSTLKNPQVSVASSLPYTSQQPAPSTNFMTRLPPQAEARARDSDEISLASLSLSSCSIASDVLRKARERRDHFWSQRRQ